MSEHTTDKSGQVIKVLRTIAHAISHTSDLDTLYEKIHRILGTIIDVTDFFIALYDKKHRNIIFPYYIDSNIKRKKSFSYTIDERKGSLTAHVISTGKTLYIKKEGILKFCLRQKAPPSGSIAAVWIGIPLKIEDEVIGIISVQSQDDENRYDRSDIALLNTISDQIAIAIDRKRYEEALKKAKKESDQTNKALIQANRALELAKNRSQTLAKRAESASHAKSQFLANMSHEIRTPLNGIIGNNELLSETELSDEQREYQKAIMISADHLLGVINDILDFSKIEAGQMELDTTPFEMKSTLNAIISTLVLKAKDKNLSLRWQVKPEVPTHLIGDPGKLRQILINLGGNAIKFTQKGSVNIICSLDQLETAKQIRLCFTVSDTGIGIPENKISSIFNKFEQADESVTRKYGGTGLGLSISKQLVEMMGGKIWVTSRKGQGSMFHFTALFETLSPKSHQRFLKKEKERHRATTVPHKPLNILLVEDNYINQQMTMKILQKQNHVVHLAEDGRKATDFLKEKAVDIILMDIQMPVMDGISATMEIRKREKNSSRHTPIIAMTAHAFKEDRIRCIDAGMDDYLSKPIDPGKLKAMIALWHEGTGKN